MRMGEVSNHEDRSSGSRRKEIKGKHIPTPDPPVRTHTHTHTHTHTRIDTLPENLVATRTHNQMRNALL